MEKTEEEKVDEPIIEVIDIENQKYILNKKIGQGGQGAVYLVKNDSDIAVKLVVDADENPVQDDSAIRAVHEKLRTIRLLPIPENINLSKPLAILKSHAGYVMTFMKGMDSFGAFMKLNEKVEEKDIPSWLKNDDGKPVDGYELWANYFKTGGLRTRLLALYKISELLASLHSNGLVYGDISYGNLMFKADGEKFTAGLIDADNINFAGKSKTFFTPGFGAPEVVTGRSHSTIFSDAYAFAVAAFYVITMLHPFKGSKVLGEENDDDWANSVSTQQKADPNNFNDDGTYPWIFDQDDDSNSYGSIEQANSLFLTPTLFALFDNTFSEGHTKPALRTPLSRWAKAFSDSADLTVKCPSCKMTYYYDKADEENGCPYCSQKRGKILIAKSYLKRSEKEFHVFAHELGKKEIFLPSRVFEPFRILKADESLVGVKFDDGAVELRALDDGTTISYSKNGGDEKILAGTVRFDVGEADSSVCLSMKNRPGYSVILTVEG